MLAFIVVDTNIFCSQLIWENFYKELNVTSVTQPNVH